MFGQRHVITCINLEVSEVGRRSFCTGWFSWVGPDGACLAEGEVGGAEGRDSLCHGGQGPLAGQVSLWHAGMCAHVHPCDTVRQLCGVVKHNDVVVQRQVQIQEAILVLRRTLKRELACMQSSTYSISLQALSIQ